MNACCTQPLEAIASDQHHGEDCCLTTEKTPAPAKAACPVSGALSRKVQRRTLEHLLKPAQRSAIRNAQYYFCNGASCRIVYFSNEDGVPVFSIDDLTVKVFAKDQSDEVPICYCFAWTRGRIKRQIEEAGQSSVSLEIAREIKAGNCACDIKNPKGECCLGEVNTSVKEVLAHLPKRSSK